MMKVIGSTKAYKVLLENSTLDMEIGMFVSDLSI